MNLITPDGGLLFWMVVIFALVFLILAKWGFPIITSSVDKRSAKIADSLKKADEIEQRVAQMSSEQEKMIAQAKLEQGRILKEAAAARDQIIQKAKDDAAAQTANMIAQAHAQIEADRKSAEAELRRDVAMLSVQVAEKVLRGTLSHSAEQAALIDRLVDEASGTDKPNN